jgi:type III secretory pathway component EscR
MDAFEILVIILSSVFALMLIALTISMFIFIKVIKDIRHITQKASLAADNIEHAAQFFKNTSGATAVMKLVGNAIETFRSKKSKKEDD